MLELHPEIIKKNGQNEFVVLTYEEFLLTQNRLADAEDVLDLRHAKADEAQASTTSLKQVKKNMERDTDP